MKTIYIFLIGSLFWSCTEEKKPEEIKEAPKYDKEQSIEMFKGFAEEEKEEIEKSKKMTKEEEIMTKRSKNFHLYKDKREKNYH